jgi:hypothetical protein
MSQEILETSAIAPENLAAVRSTVTARTVILPLVIVGAV